jgi:nucleoside-diphosphate-sugar epimerase
LRVLVTGHHGYIGTLLVPLAQQAGHEVVGLDSDMFAPCVFGTAPAEVESIRKDVRDIEVADLEGFDGILHLAAVCNDPVGNLNPQVTYDINQIASAELAAKAKQAGVERFVFFSSCSLYGKADGADALDESAGFAPQTAYGESKVLAERDIAPLADDAFTPVYLRNATAYGVSNRLRLDVVVNNLVGWAVTTGELVMQSDGTPWRPLVHIEDISRAALACLVAPKEKVHNEAFNVCASEENYTIREVAEIVSEVTGAPASFADGTGEPDTRSYRVDGSKLARVLPDAVPQWTVKKGAEELYATYKEWGMTYEDFTGPLGLRLKKVNELQSAGLLDGDLRWTSVTVA